MCCCEGSRWLRLWAWASWAATVVGTASAGLLFEGGGVDTLREQAGVVLAAWFGLASVLLICQVSRCGRCGRGGGDGDGDRDGEALAAWAGLLGLVMEFPGAMCWALAAALDWREGPVSPLLLAASGLHLLALPGLIMDWSLISYHVICCLMCGSCPLKRRRPRPSSSTDTTQDTATASTQASQSPASDPTQATPRSASDVTQASQSPAADPNQGSQRPAQPPADSPV